VELREWIRQPAAWIILVVGALASLLAWRSLSLEAEATARSAFEEAVAESREAIEARLRGYRTVLYGLQGLFHGDARIDAAGFSRYVRSLDAAQAAMHLRSVSYAPRVPHAQRASFEAAARAELSGFAIQPQGERAEYLPIRFIEPQADNEAGFGLDLGADPVRRGAVEATRDTGTIRASASFTLLSARDEPATSLRLAVYRPQASLDGVEARRQAFAGVVSVTFGIGHLLMDLVSSQAGSALGMRVSDAGRAIYERGEALRAPDAFRAASHIDVGGRAWLLEFAAPRESFRMESSVQMSWLVLFGGLTISALLAGLVGLLATSSKRAHRIASEITADLRRSQAELEESQRKTQVLIETLPNPVFFKGTDGRYLGVNRAWEAFFNVPREAIVGKPVHALYPHAPEVADRLHEKDLALWGEPGTQVYETAITLPDGRRRDAVYYKATFTGPDGAMAGLIGTIVDVTEARQAARRQAMEHAVTQVLANAQSATRALPETMRTICEAFGWACGAYWSAHGDTLRREAMWHIDAPEVADFLSAEASATDRELPPRKSGGLLRRIWRDGAPVWIHDVASEPQFRRGRAAARAGLHCAFGFPVVARGDRLGVMEFFGRSIKQPDPELLAATRSLGSQIGQFIVRKEAEERVRFVATHDALTALPNRVMFAQRLEHALAQTRRHGRRLAVLFLDLDRFKVINDTLGHDFGDALLREVARRLKESLRASDTVARLGGDEFVVLLEEIADPMYVTGVAQKIIAALGEAYVLAGREYHVTASVGASTFPDDAGDAQALLKNADIAMYRAKEQGRNTFQFYSSHLNLHSVQRLNLESGLRRALEREELVLHYQPLLDLRSGRITGVEALVRWQHPELGLLSPGRFIPIAEETGMIVPIGEWVMRTACAAQRAWADEGLAPLRVAVNLSARQFLRGDLPRDIRAVVDATGADPERLEIEITESMVMQDPERVVALLHQIRGIGVRVAIDDFGTGHSSLAYLKRFPVDNLKIDRSFVAGVPGDRGDVAITQAVIAMGHSLGMRVIAEGVETRAQREFLLAQHCDEFQGYLFSKPLAAPDLRPLLEAEAGKVRLRAGGGPGLRR
jgi:diguanylate cyclase (GGDEF)-like protein/PAS domain S-box-containing protein